MLINGKRPNILILMSDEERFPPGYENEEARQWRLEHGKARLEISRHGLEFLHHYTGSTACAPSRASLFTGQYPSLHGVSQTSGLAKSSADPAMFWLDPGTVPTFGDFLRTGGYQTHYNGKWHVSDADIMVPGSNNGLLSNGPKGEPYEEKIAHYASADRLDGYGFHSWIGPDPHGALINNTGTVRDPGFARQATRIIERLDERAAKGEDDRPWFLVCSFVNPHDIVFSGPLMRARGWFPEFYRMLEEHPERLADVAPPPTLGEPLQSKPRVQQDYRLQYPRMYMPQPVNETYFRLYYWLMAEVDRHFGTVYNTLKASRFFEETIVILTSDHGDMLGAHGGMMQKWHNAYEEAIHVPLVVSNPVLFPEARTTELLSSHLDLLPTVLGLTDIDQDEALARLAPSHCEAHRLVGRDLSSQIEGTASGDAIDNTLYFMTDDQISLGLNQTNALQQPYRPIIQPNSVETVITRMADEHGELKLWKYSRYFDNRRFGTGTPGPGVGVGNADTPYTAAATEEMPVPDEWECYNLTDDPFETDNLLCPLCPNPLPQSLERQLHELLEEQRRTKRKLPQNNNRMVDDNDRAPVYG